MSCCRPRKLSEVRAMPKVIEYNPVRGLPEQQGVPLRLSEDIMTISFKTYSCRECLKAIDEHSWGHSWVLVQQFSHVLDDRNATMMDGDDASCKFMSERILLLVCKSFDECTAMKVKNCWGDIRLTRIYRGRWNNYSSPSAHAKQSFVMPRTLLQGSATHAEREWQALSSHEAPYPA